MSFAFAKFCQQISFSRRFEFLNFVLSFNVAFFSVLYLLVTFCPLISPLHGTQYNNNKVAWPAMI